MARREIYVDDLDGKEHEDVQARRFSIGRQGYSIDLSDANYEKFLKAVEPFVSVATKEEAPSRSLRASTGRSRATSTTIYDKGYTAAEVREWAKKEGLEISTRGRIHKDVLERYEYAHGLDKK